MNEPSTSSIDDMPTNIGVAVANKPIFIVTNETDLNEHSSSFELISTLSAIFLSHSVSTEVTTPTGSGGFKWRLDAASQEAPAECVSLGHNVKWPHGEWSQNSPGVKRPHCHLATTTVGHNFRPWVAFWPHYRPLLLAKYRSFPVEKFWSNSKGQTPCCSDWSVEGEKEFNKYM